MVLGASHDLVLVFRCTTLARLAWPVTTIAWSHRRPTLSLVQLTLCELTLNSYARDKANADAQQQSLLQQLTDARATAPASAPGSDLTEQDRAELERLREADHARQLEEARLRLPANIDDIDREFGNNLRLYPRQKPYTARQKPYTAGSKIPSAHEWTVNEGYWLDLVGAKTPKWASIAASNLADGTARTQFWTASPVSKEHATIMSKKTDGKPPVCSVT